MARECPCTKNDYLATLRKRLEGTGTESYKKMISEEIGLIEKISEEAFCEYYSVLEGLFNNGR
jgi:hypothetical protein